MLLACSAQAAGPLAVTTRDLAFVDPEFGRGKVKARIYFPPAEDGPYPLVGFQHGWLGQAYMYDDLCQEVASQGFVVASTDTETGLVLDYTAFAGDTRAILHYVAAGSEDWLEGLVSDDPWTAMGHSMGGGTLGKLVGEEPNIARVVAFMPYKGDPGDYDTLSTFPGAALYLDATEDTTAPPPMSDRWFGSFTGARGLEMTIAGAGHMAVTDDAWGEVTSMPHARQHQVVIDLATAFLRAEALGDEDRYRDLVGPGAPEVFDGITSSSPDPALWADLDGDRIELGVVGEPGDTATVYVGSDPDHIDTVLGDPIALPDGWAVADREAPPDGALWVRASLGSHETRSVLLRDAAPETPTATTPSTTPDPETDTDPVPEPPTHEDAATGGCGCGGGPSTGWSALLALALVVRTGRRRP